MSHCQTQLKRNRFRSQNEPLEFGSRFFKSDVSLLPENTTGSKTVRELPQGNSEEPLCENGSFLVAMDRGSIAAGERAANLLTIIGSAIRNDFDVRECLDDVLRQALGGETNWSAMTPHAWRAEHPESIREYRADERRQAADRKRTRRAHRRLLNKSTGRR